MKQLFITLLVLLQASLVFAQQEKKYILKGNELFHQQKFNEAEANYRKALQKANKNLPGNFNLGDALYKEKKYDQAGQQFNKIAAESKHDKSVAAEAYHNLGNSLLQSKKLEESIAAYKKSLLNNPKDDQTRYNLAYAQELLKNKNKNNKNNNKNKDKNKNNQDKNQNKNKDKQNQDKQNQNPNKQDDKNRDPQQKQPQDPNQISRDQAEQMLNALNNDEKATQDKLKNQKLKGEKVKISKDW